MIHTLFRLRTFHGTYLFFEESTGILRHNSSNAIRNNFLVYLEYPKLHIIHIDNIDVTYIEKSHLSRCTSTSEVNSGFIAQYIGLNQISISDGCNFLSSERGGFAGFTKEECRDWEVYTLEPVKHILFRQSFMMVDSTPEIPPEALRPSAVNRISTNSDIETVAEHRITYTFVGFFVSNWSLAAVNRRITQVIESAYAGSARIIVENDPPCIGGSSQEQALLIEISKRPKATEGLNVVIHQRWPVSPPQPSGKLTLAYFFWEVTRVPQSIISILNDYDGVLAPAESVRSALLNSGLLKPVEVIGFCPDLRSFESLFQDRLTRPTGHRPYTFLHVSSGEPRKGIDVLLKAYAKTFSKKDAVRLVIKGRPHISDKIAQFRISNSDAPPVILVDNDLEHYEIINLYAEADAMVLPTRGEGFNIPAAEAIASGLHLIVTGAGGHMDFCTTDVARLLKYELVPSEDQFNIDDARWAEVDVDDLSKAMSEAKAGVLSTTCSARLEALKLLRPAGWSARLDCAISKFLSAKLGSQK